MTVFAIPTMLARGAWGMIGASPVEAAAHTSAVALTRIQEVEKERDDWMHACEELDEENELLRKTIGELNRRTLAK